MNTRIVYDYQIFSDYQHGGVSRYFCEIASLIDRDKDFDVKILSPIYINKHLQSSNFDFVTGYSSEHNSKVLRKISRLINFQASKLLLNLDPPDIIHETYYSSSSVASKKTKKIITVYDMIHEKYSSCVDPKQDFAKIKATAIRRADHIICISDSTKKDLIKYLQIDESKISTIYLAGEQKLTSSNELPKIEFPYLLYVGQRGKYKNFNKLLEAYASSKRLSHDFYLVCFGGGSLSDSEISLINQLKISDRIIHESGNDDTLINLYKQAAAFVYPSLYEGFGIPPLEAMSYNCPVVCSNTSSIPEVVGDAGEYFDPHDVDSMITSIENVVYSSDLAVKISRLGRERTKLFSWESCAQKTMEVYNSLL